MQYGIYDPETVKDDSPIFQHPTTNAPTSYKDLLNMSQKVTNGTNTILCLPMSGIHAFNFGSTPKYDDLYLNTRLHKKIHVQDLFKMGLINHVQLQNIEQGVMSLAETEKMVKTFLNGDPPISGVLYNNETLNLYQAYNRDLLAQTTFIDLLEAQVSSIGHIVDPTTGILHNLDNALQLNLFDKFSLDTLNRARKAIQGFHDPLSGNLLSLYEAIKEGYVAEVRAIKNLEAQLATGGIMDTSLGIRIPVSKAVQRNLIDQKLVNRFKDSSRTGDGKYIDPNTHEINLTYLDLIKRTVTDRSNDAVLLVINKKAVLQNQNQSNNNNHNSSHNHYENSNNSTHKYPENNDHNNNTNDENNDQNNENNNSTNQNHSNMDDSNSIIPDNTSTTTTSKNNYDMSNLSNHENENANSGSPRVPKRRKQRKRKIVIVDTTTGEEISIKLAYERGIIDEKIFNELSAQQGIYQKDNHSGNENVRNPFSSNASIVKSTSTTGSPRKSVLGKMIGTSLTAAAQMNSKQSENDLKDKLKQLQIINEKQVCIAGILDVSIGADPTLKALTIRKAREKHLIDDTTALRLLEAQAATGGIIDDEGCRYNLKEARSLDLITNKDVLRLDEAEKSYYGFKDRLTGKMFSISEALRRGKVSYDICTRMMEYQVATGKYFYRLVCVYSS